ncbi:MAG: hypothetical protein ACI4F7_04825 [Acutalibacteraceae bacterium]
MKRKYFVCLSLALLMLTSSSVIALKPAEVGDNKPAVQTVDTDKVLEARFLNMLNHSFAYGEDLGSVEALVNCSVAALCNMDGGAEGSFMEETRIKDYLYNMYGVEAENVSSVNAEYPHKDGYVYIIPRGYTVYKHTIDSVRINEDGSYTVTTLVTVDSHDGEENGKAVTLFVKNSGSQFGFNIISSEIIVDAFEA